MGDEAEANFFPMAVNELDGHPDSCKLYPEPPWPFFRIVFKGLLSVALTTVVDIVTGFFDFLDFFSDFMLLPADLKNPLVLS